MNKYEQMIKDIQKKYPLPKSDHPGMMIENPLDFCFFIRSNDGIECPDSIASNIDLVRLYEIKRIKKQAGV